MSKATWIVEFNCPDAIVPGHMIRTNDDARCPIALLWVGGGTEDKPHQVANANLMAAAPDLLAALEGLCWREPGAPVRFCHHAAELCPNCAAARAAIARAKGEEESWTKHGFSCRCGKLVHHENDMCPNCQAAAAESLLG